MNDEASARRAREIERMERWLRRNAFPASRDGIAGCNRCGHSPAAKLANRDVSERHEGMLSRAYRFLVRALRRGA